MAKASIPTSVLSFLKDLANNNNRDWFNANKERYQEQHQYLVAFAEQLHEEMSHYDELEPSTGKKILFRIYRDTRFSKNKTPYKINFAGGLKRATKWRRGGYYFHIQPGQNFLGGGFWAPNSADLARIRKEIAADQDSMRKLITDPVFVDTFGELGGDKVKTAPKGYSKDHSAIDLLRYKQYLLTRQYTDAEVTSADFMDKLVQHFRHMRPFFDYMSEVLTTDENGVPIE